MVEIDEEMIELSRIKKWEILVVRAQSNQLCSGLRSTRFLSDNCPTNKLSAR
jgi:hypothetical protein